MLKNKPSKLFVMYNLAPQMNKSQISYIILFAFGLITLFSCKKDALTNPNFELGFSTDTLSFDTVFVTLGSTTKFFAVKNAENKPVVVSKIELEGGSDSKYRINVDGVSLPNGVIENITIPAKDSIYIFVEITVDPNAEALPFLIRDRILFETNSSEQQVVLESYGQNAHFFNGEEIETQTWEDDLPFVILNSILVKENHTLTIKEGVDIYFGGGSAMYVAGNIIVEGSKDSTVTFRGVRLDEIAEDLLYDEIPGQWLGLFLLRSNSGNINSTIKYAEIRNAQFGISLGSTTLEEFPNITLANGPVLDIENTIIQNHSVFAFFGITSTIRAKNLLVYQAGAQLMALQMGGNYQFEHCTFYNRGSQFLEHTDELLYFSNYFADINAGIIIERDLERLDFLNCIIYGSLEDEILPDTVEGTNAAFNYNFDHCLLKSKLEFDENANNCLYNLNPNFFEPEDPEEAIDNDFRLNFNSPCIDGGNPVFTATFDLYDFPRIGLPDIGALEFMP
jgi:hypothetical protein